MKKIHGNKGKKFTDEHKKKISEANKISKIKHGMFGTRFYGIFYKAKWRCQKTHPACKYYYNKGIMFLWKSFTEFKDDMYKSYLEHIKEYGEKQTQIDRIDSNKHYCKENCRWATLKEQNKNRNLTHTYNLKNRECK
jgi:hypothetical protein